MKTSGDLITDVIRRESGGKDWNQTHAQRHEADRGGWTRAGVTATNAGTFLGFGRPATPEELNAMTEAQARAFYERRYLSIYDFVPEPLKILLGDWSVTSGHDDPIKALQVALTQRGVYQHPDGRLGQVDGIAGPLTRQAVVHDPNPRQTYREVFQARIRHARAVAFDAQVREFLRTHPTSQLVNLAGWINRTLEFCP